MQYTKEERECRKRRQQEREREREMIIDAIEETK